jgi:hypothetical protein
MLDFTVYTLSVVWLIILVLGIIGFIIILWEEFK